MIPLSMDTKRLRYLLKQFKEKEYDVQICSAKDIIGPGGGTYIKANAVLGERHLNRLEHRSLTPLTPTYVDVVFHDSGSNTSNALSEFDLAAEPAQSQKERHKKAEETSREVTARAQEVVKQAGELYRSVDAEEFSATDLQSAEGEASLKEFEKRFKAFEGAVQDAVGEYLSGNTLVMDLILKFQLDKEKVGHGLKVAAFATEMGSLLALRGRESGEQLADYFGDMSYEALLVQLGETAEKGADLAAGAMEGKRFQLFKKELVETFLGGHARLWAVDRTGFYDWWARSHRSQTNLGATGSPRVCTCTGQNSSIPFGHCPTGDSLRSCKSHRGTG